MALAMVVRITGIRFHDLDTIQIMLSYLCLEKDLCQFTVKKMDKSTRLVIVIIMFKHLRICNRCERIRSQRFRIQKI